jgi:transcription regulator MmyB-like protein/helix-turn-helix protein
MVERHELGSVLRGWRERLPPAAVGFPDAGGQRRARGLRREELASLACVSPDYIKRLEQGRARPSAAVLDSLARALRLTRAEYEYLCVLAGHAATGTGQVPRHIGPGAQRLLDRLSDVPACVYDAAWTMLTCNASWAAVSGDQAAWQGRDRNRVWRHFTGQSSRMSKTPEETEHFEALMVADLRATAGQYPADRWLADLITDLRAASSRFCDLWDSGAVARHREDRKTVHHPEVGAITLDCDVLTIHGSDLRLVVLTAEPGSADADRLAVVNVIGLQDMDPARGHPAVNAVPAAFEPARHSGEASQ